MDHTSQWPHAVSLHHSASARAHPPVTFLNGLKLSPETHSECRRRNSSTTHHSVVPLGHGHDGVVDARRPGGGLDLLSRRGQVAVRDVVVYRVVEQDHVLLSRVISDAAIIMSSHRRVWI